MLTGRRKGDGIVNASVVSAGRNLAECSNHRGQSRRREKILNEHVIPLISTETENPLWSFFVCWSFPGFQKIEILIDWDIVTCRVMFMVALNEMLQCQNGEGPFAFRLGANPKITWKTEELMSLRSHIQTVCPFEGQLFCMLFCPAS